MVRSALYDYAGPVSDHSLEDLQGPLFLGAGVSPYDRDLQHDFEISHLPLSPHRNGKLVIKQYDPAARSLGMR